jgi:hypothetical protein
MKILDPGHRYELDEYDVPASQLRVVDAEDFKSRQALTFVKRSGPTHPYNHNSYPGTTCQEVLRALKDRVAFLHKQVPCWHNHLIMLSLNTALYMFELRNAQIKHRKWPNPFYLHQEPGKDGHFLN